MAVRWIAEIGSNHNQDIVRTLKLIDEAKRIGCWAVKFQLFRAEQLYHSSFTEQIEKMKKWELPEHFIDYIRLRCDTVGIKFICTPFDLGAVELLKDKVDWLKIGSYELMYTDLIQAVAKTGKKWMISAGMESFELSNNFMQHIRAAEREGRFCENPPSVIFACNSNYPAKVENCNLKNINKLKNYFRPSRSGWSDHTTYPGVIYKAIACGAEYIEFHFDLGDAMGFEYSVGHCWLPNEIEEVIKNVRIGEVAYQNNDTGETEAMKWRTDPVDGLRPMREYRKELLNAD